MSQLTNQPRVTSFAPQFLVDDLARSIAYYRKLGFRFGAPWEGFYAIGERDGLELHLKVAPKSSADRQYRRAHDHLDAAAGVDGIEAFYEECIANGATILRPLTATAWGTKDFYVEDPDGYIIAFGGRPSQDWKATAHTPYESQLPLCVRPLTLVGLSRCHPSCERCSCSTDFLRSSADLLATILSYSASRGCSVTPPESWSSFGPRGLRYSAAARRDAALDQATARRSASASTMALGAQGTLVQFFTGTASANKSPLPIMRSPPTLVSLTIAAIGSACGRLEPDYCAPVPPWALFVVVSDSVTHRPLALGTIGTADAPGIHDTLITHPGDSTALYSRGNSPGTYRVALRHHGYRDWTTEGVQVVWGKCGGGNVLVQARLQPDSP